LAAEAREVAEQRLVLDGDEAARALPSATAEKLPQLERRARRGDTSTREHARGVRIAGQKARFQGLQNKARGHNPALLETFPGMKYYVEQCVAEMGGRANERRNSTVMSVKTTWAVLAAMASERFDTKVTARALSKWAAKHRRGKPLAIDVSTRVVERKGLPTEAEQPNAFALNHSLKYLTRWAYRNAGLVVMMGRDDHAIIKCGVSQKGRMLQVCSVRPASVAQRPRHTCGVCRLTRGPSSMWTRRACTRKPCPPRFLVLP
jgi:hypothetical protein